VQSTQQTLQQLKSSIDDINQYKKAKEILEKAALNIISYLEKKRFAQVLSSMTHGPANQVWVKSMKETEVDVKIAVREGQHRHRKFMRNLERSKHLTSVDLVSSKQTEIAATS